MAANFLDIEKLVQEDIENLKIAEKSYGDSWRSRGGVGAFMMLARKWDRIENQVSKDGYDVFKTIAKDLSDTGILDDIRDLRRYLLLVEAYANPSGKYLGKKKS
tara:strand:+ start:285 stop:596 length:312 start_codon:yes stop_codon:yes gene_type:complete